LKKSGLTMRAYYHIYAKLRSMGDNRH